MFLKRIFSNNYFLATVILDILTIALILVLQSFLPPVVPLLYGRPVGEGQLVPRLWLIIAPIASLAITLINIPLNLWVKDDFLKKIIAISTLVISCVTTITVIKIILLVGFF
ncbi:MAG: hypothetical protein ABSC49_00895 [Candidatus Microgenomates bacterium]|jgi:hypothetical protein